MDAALKIAPVGSTQPPEPAELFARARALVPVLRERAEATAAGRRVPAKTTEMLKAAGLFRILQSKRWGGYEMSPAIFYEVQTILGEGDMAVAWVFGIVGVHNWHLALFDDRAASDVWGEDTGVLIASTYMPVGKVTPVEGGYRLSGHWRFSSGCDNADWILLGGMLPTPDGAQEPGTLLVPKADYRILPDSWEVGGLRGTGSKDVVVEDAFVPAYRTHRHREGFVCDSPGNRVNTAPLYRLPFGQVFIRAVNGSAIGAVRGLADQIAAFAAKRGSPGGGSTADLPTTQVAVGEAIAAVTEMRMVLRGTFAALLDYAGRGEQAPLEERATYKFHAAQTTTRAVDLAMALYRVAGGTGLQTAMPFSRMVDDIVAARQHQFNQDFPYATNVGGLVMGRDNTDWFL